MPSPREKCTRRPTGKSHHHSAGEGVDVVAAQEAGAIGRWEVGEQRYFDEIVRVALLEQRKGQGRGVEMHWRQQAAPAGKKTPLLLEAARSHDCKG